MSKPASHELDVYGTRVHLATDRRAWATLRRRYPGLIDHAPEDAGLCRVATFHPNSGGLTQYHVVFWINLAQHNSVAELIDTCSHEATHGALSVMDYIGHDPRGTSDEPLAYLIGWLTKWIWANLPHRLS